MRKHMKLFLVTLVLSGSIANTSIASTICSPNEILIKNKKIINYDILNSGYMSVKLAGETTWRSVHAYPERSIQDYAKVAYLTGASLDYCLANGRIVRMARAHDVN